MNTLNFVTTLSTTTKFLLSVQRTEEKTKVNFLMKGLMNAEMTKRIIFIKAFIIITLVNARN